MTSNGSLTLQTGNAPRPLSRIGRRLQAPTRLGLAKAPIRPTGPDASSQSANLRAGSAADTTKNVIGELRSLRGDYHSLVAFRRVALRQQLVKACGLALRLSVSERDRKCFYAVKFWRKCPKPPRFAEGQDVGDVLRHVLRYMIDKPGREASKTASRYAVHLAPLVSAGWPLERVAKAVKKYGYLKAAAKAGLTNITGAAHGDEEHSIDDDADTREREGSLKRKKAKTVVFNADAVLPALQKLASDTVVRIEAKVVKGPQSIRLKAISVKPKPG